jgi:hypothetical protein
MGKKAYDWQFLLNNLLPVRFSFVNRVGNVTPHLDALSDQSKVPAGQTIFRWKFKGWWNAAK